jgi:hypothetical protein
VIDMTREELIEFAMWLHEGTEYFGKSYIERKTDEYLRMKSKVIEHSGISDKLICQHPDKTIKTDWDIRKCFEQLRLDKSYHLGEGDIRLTIEQQEKICELVERFYRCS